MSEPGKIPELEAMQTDRILTEELRRDRQRREQEAKLRGKRIEETLKPQLPRYTKPPTPKKV